MLGVMGALGELRVLLGGASGGYQGYIRGYIRGNGSAKSLQCWVYQVDQEDASARIRGKGTRDVGNRRGLSNNARLLANYAWPSLDRSYLHPKECCLIRLADTQKRQPAKISWWTPYWFHVPRTRRTWGLLFRPRIMARVLILSLVAGAGIVVALKAANPLMQLPPVWKMALAVPSVYAYFALMLVVHLALPTHVHVSKKRLHSITGQSHWGVEATAITRTRITVFAHDRVRLRVYYDRKGKNRSRVFGVARKVNLDVLADVLPVYPEVRDARHRYERTRPDCKHCEAVASPVA